MNESAGGPETVRPFSFAASLDSSSLLCVTRQIFRSCLIVGLLGAMAFAGWTWFRPYAWDSDPAARCKIVSTWVKPDASYFWVEVHVRMRPGMSHDLQKPVWLEMGNGKKLEPADTTFGGKEELGTTDIWFKFWLETADLDRTLSLHLNDGKLSIKANQGTPQLGGSDERYFTTNQW